MNHRAPVFLRHSVVSAMFDANITNSELSINSLRPPLVFRPMWTLRADMQKVKPLTINALASNSTHSQHSKVCTNTANTSSFSCNYFMIAIACRI